MSCQYLQSIKDFLIYFSHIHKLQKITFYKLFKICYIWFTQFIVICKYVQYLHVLNDLGLKIKFLSKKCNIGCKTFTSYILKHCKITALNWAYSLYSLLYLVNICTCKYLQCCKYIQSITILLVYFNDIYKLHICISYKYFLESHLKSRLYILYTSL